VKFLSSSFLKPFNARAGVMAGNFFGHNSAAARAREVFKPSTDSASLLISTAKNISFLCLGFFLGTSQERVFLRFYGQLYPALGVNPMIQFFGSRFFGN